MVQWESPAKVVRDIGRKSACYCYSFLSNIEFICRKDTPIYCIGPGILDRSYALRWLIDFRRLKHSLKAFLVQSHDWVYNSTLCKSINKFDSFVRLIITKKASLLNSPRSQLVLGSSSLRPSHSSLLCFTFFYTWPFEPPFPLFVFFFLLFVLFPFFPIVICHLWLGTC